MKKFTWEVDKTSLILRVTDGAKETTWKLRKNMSLPDVSQALEDMWLALQNTGTVAQLAQELMPTAEEREKAWEESSSVSVQADTEEGSLEALRARERVLRQTAKWWDNDDEESAFVASLPDYDTGEI